MKVEFYKYEGTGNDFIILDNRNNQYDNLSLAQVKFMCDRHFGIGADGLMLLNLIDGFDFKMTYYNSDGGESTMCGNGGRCLVKFAYDIGIHLAMYRFVAIDGPHQAHFDEHNWVYLKMKDVNEITQHSADFITDTGSPHYVKMVGDIQDLNVFEEGKKIRYSNEFKEKGINVNFVQLASEGISVRTYERGVEDETLSCGTGVTAAALVFANNNYDIDKVSVQTPGGNLAVKFEREDNKFTNVWLCGPATFVFKGQITLK